MRGFEELIGRGREHYLWTRHAEIEKLRGQPSRDARINRTYEELVTAREHGRVVRRVFESNGIEPPNLSLLDRWIALLARHAERLEAA